MMATLMMTAALACSGPGDLMVQRWIINLRSHDALADLIERQDKAGHVTAQQSVAGWGKLPPAANRPVYNPLAGGK